MSSDSIPGFPRNRPRRPRIAHGLDAADIVLHHESERDWKRFHREICTALQPVGAIERALASRVAECLWRARRLVVHERRLIEDDFGREQAEAWRRRRNSTVVEELKALDFFADKQDEDPGTYIMPKPRHLPRESGIELVIRYEAHIARQMHYALHELEALQHRRSGGSAPLARVAVHGLPGT